MNQRNEVILLVDLSLSMERNKSFLIRLLNDFIKDQIRINRSGTLLIAGFNQTLSIIRDKNLLSNYKEISHDDISFFGGTALYDSIGKMISYLDQTGRKATMAIFTDGIDSHSEIFTPAEIEKLLSKKREEGWEFVLGCLGARPLRELFESRIAQQCTLSYYSEDLEDVLTTMSSFTSSITKSS